MKLLMILYILFLANIQIGVTLTPPTLPKMPTLPTIVKKSNLTTKENKIPKIYSYEVEIVLNKGSRTKGTISLLKNYITVSRKKGDFSYQKKILLKDILSIEIISWWESKMTHKSNSTEIPYIFYPIKFRVKTTKRKIYIYKGRLPQFERFKLTSILGKTTVHSIFYDYWVLEGKKGYWYNNKSLKFYYNRTHPHPLAVKKINFKKRN